MRVNGTEMYLRRFKIYAAATMPASAMSKVDYFRVARDGCTDSSNRSPWTPPTRPLASLTLYRAARKLRLTLLLVIVMLPRSCTRRPNP
jgi:hypothetical protein